MSINGIFGGGKWDGEKEQAHLLNFKMFFLNTNQWSPLNVFGEKLGFRIFVVLFLVDVFGVGTVPTKNVLFFFASI